MQAELVAAGGLEPPTCGLWDVRTLWMPFHATSRPRAKAGAGEARSGTISVRDGNARQGPESRVLLHVVRWGL